VSGVHHQYSDKTAVMMSSQHLTQSRRSWNTSTESVPWRCSKNIQTSSSLIVYYSSLSSWVLFLLCEYWVFVQLAELIAQVKACSRETYSPSQASKIYGHNAFQIIHIHTTVINSVRAHTTQHRIHCGVSLWSS